MIPSQSCPPRRGCLSGRFVLAFISNLSALLRRFAMAGMAAGLLASCASPFPPALALAGNLDYTYIIGAGDGVNIIVWRNPELSMSVPVRPDGKIAAPLVDELVAQGKTPVQLARDVEQVLSKYVRDPVVTVLVTGFVGPYLSLIHILLYLMFALNPPKSRIDDVPMASAKKVAKERRRFLNRLRIAMRRSIMARSCRCQTLGRRRAAAVWRESCRPSAGSYRRRR